MSDHGVLRCRVRSSAPTGTYLPIQAAAAVSFLGAWDMDGSYLDMHFGKHAGRANIGRVSGLLVDHYQPVEGPFLESKHILAERDLVSRYWYGASA
jgi:hypothetical protein